MKTDSTASKKPRRKPYDRRAGSVRRAHLEDEAPGGPEAQLRDLWERQQLSAAAELIITAYGPGIAGYLSAVVREDGLTRDAFSEFGEELWKSLPRFRRASSFRSWAYGIAHHCALRQLRSARRRRVRPLRDTELSRLAAEVCSRSLSASVARRTEEVERLRNLLSANEQALLTLRVDRGMAWEEIASVLGGGENAALLRKRFERIKRRLRSAVEGRARAHDGRLLRAKEN